MKIGDRVFVQGYVDEIRRDIVIIRNEGGYFGTLKSEIISNEDIIRNTGNWIYGEDESGQDGWFCSRCHFFIPWYYNFYNDIDFIRDYRTCPCCDSKMLSYTGEEKRGKVDG